MQKKYRMRFIIIVIFCLMITSISVAYASLNTKLTIEGNATFKSSKWEIKFSNVEINIQGNGEISTPPEINNSRIENFSVKLTKKNDAVIINFDVENTGTMDSYIDSLLLGEISCISTLETPVLSDAELVCNNLDYTLTYTDDTTKEQTGIIIPKGTEVSETQKLLKGKKVNMTLKIEYMTPELPSGNVEISIGETTILYKQEIKNL